MDAKVIERLKIPTVPVSGKMNLAVLGTSVPRSSMTVPIPVSAIFPSPAHALPLINFNYAFETAHLDPSYQFLIGIDLIDLFFPNGLPRDYFPSTNRAISTRLSQFTISANAASITSGSASASGSTHDADVIIPRDPSERECFIKGLAELQTEIHDTGAGAAPELERPERTKYFTSEELEKTYGPQREKIFADPAVQEALRINNEISGFCNLPDSVVRIEVDPAKEATLFRRQYKIPHALLDLTGQCIQRWLVAGKIALAPVNCPYNNPIMVAPKKDENGIFTAIRVCMDTRALNAALILTDRFQLPVIRHSLEDLMSLDACIFGEFDLNEAYLQFQIHPDSQKYLAFTFKNIQYVMVGCPYGLTHIPSLFQRIMSNNFSNLSFTFPYIDNLPVGSRTWEEHREHILFIILRLNELNLRIKPSSIKIGHSHMKCLGHLISANGIEIDPDKLKTIAAWELPGIGKDLARFLGFCNFVCAHMRNHADLVAALNAIKTFDNTPIAWTPELIEQFENVKLAYSRAPLLQFPKYELPFFIACDASNTGVGGVLYQPLPGSNEITPRNMVAICSHKLTGSQINYSAYKKELFGVVHCLRQFHAYIWGRNDLVIYTDHNPLTFMLSSPKLSPALQQWLDVILDYKFEIRHRPGIANVVPDILSRMFTSLYPSTWGVMDETSAATLKRFLPEAPKVVDEEIVPVVSTSLSRRGEDGSINISALTLEEVTILMEESGKIIPETVEEQTEMIEQEHMLGHFGRDAVFKKLYAKGYWWPKMRKAINAVIADCDACAKFVVVKSGFNPATYITANAPWDHIQIDTSIHLPESADGYVVLLVVIDVFTGFILLRALKGHTAEMVAEKLLLIFADFGFPKIIQSDNGPEFANDVLRSLVKISGINHRLISPYNPRCDGKVERAIGTVMSIIKKELHGSDRCWPLFVAFAQTRFNDKIASLTNSSPFALMFARTMNELKDYSNANPDGQITTQEEWKRYQEKVISLIYPAIREVTYDKKEAMVKRLNAHRRNLLPNAIPEGATVMINDVTRKNKFEPKYIGPYEVVRRSRNGQYVLRFLSDDRDILDRHVPADQIKIISRQPREKDKANDVYVIEKILNHRGNPGAYEYEIKWKGYWDSTWEPQQNILDSPIVNAYWNRQNMKESKLLSKKR